MKKIVALFLALVLALSMVSFAAAEEPVKLVWWLFAVGDAPADWPEVEAKLNEISTREIGVTCEFKYMTEDQNNLAMNSGEYFDICFTCDWWNDFATNVSNDMFADLTDLVKEYGQEMSALMPENIWIGGQVGDKLYAIPHVKDYGIEVFWILDTDYFINQKGLEEDHYISFDGIEPYLEMYKKDYPDDYPLKIYKVGVTSWLNALADWINQAYYIALDIAAEGTDDQFTVKSALDIPAFGNRLRTIHSWYEKGYINPDAAVTESLPRSQASVVQSGQGWFGAETVWSNARKQASYISRYDGPFLTTYSVRGAMTAISSTSKHPVEAMKLINLMNSNEEYRTVARYGIEGKHFTTESEGIVVRTQEGMDRMNPNAYGQGTYALGPVEASPFESVPANPHQWTELVERYEKEAVTSPIMGFTFDITPVQDECLAMASIWEQYIYELQTGTSDPDVVFPELRAKLEAVGLQKVIDEAQSQLNAFLGK